MSTSWFNVAFHVDEVELLKKVAHNQGVAWQVWVRELVLMSVRDRLRVLQQEGVEESVR